MPTLPWSPGEGLDAPTTAVVMASRFRLRRLHQVPRFLLDSVRIRRQVQAADGALGVSLVARPLQREFSTLSAWRDRQAIDVMVTSEPHLGAMRRHRRAMAESTFTVWQVPVEDLPVPWEQARLRLDAERRTSSEPR